MTRSIAFSSLASAASAYMEILDAHHRGKATKEQVDRAHAVLAHAGLLAAPHARAEVMTRPSTNRNSKETP